MKQILKYVVIGLSLVLLASCHKDEDLSDYPLFGSWMQTSSSIDGDISYPEEQDAPFLYFTKWDMTRYSSYSDKYEETESLGYKLKVDVLWYDTGNRTFTRNETVQYTGSTLRITQSNGNYEDYKKISALPFSIE